MLELRAEELRRTCEPDSLQCTSSKEARVLETIIGQERAVKSLRFGLDIQELGFNIFVSGIPGTGRTTAVRNFLQEVARQKPEPDDWCYVYNLQDPVRPRALRLPAGRARQFQADMKRLVSGAQREIRTAFESEEYARHRQQVSQSYQRQREEVFGNLNTLAREQGFVIQASPMGLLTVPLSRGQPMSEEEFAALKSEEREAILGKRDRLQTDIEAAIRQGKRLERSASDALQKLDQDVARFALAHLVEDLREAYQNLPVILAYLDQVQEDMLQNLAQFQSEGSSGEEAEAPEAPEGGLHKYEVNVLVDNSALQGAPVVIEQNPTYGNLMGRIEQEVHFGALVTQFTLIRGGALHRANGGYLVLPAEQVLGNPFAWDSLKRALANRAVSIEDLGERVTFAATKSLRPEPIPLDVKVILIGEPELYHALRGLDEEFGELFKVKADFDVEMDRTAEAMQQYAGFVRSVAENEGLRHLDASALGKLVEHGSRIVEDQQKLSTHFGEIADIIREASYYAAQEDAPMATFAHVCRAIDERFYRSALIQERLHEMIERGTILIDTAGETVGQVNGLSVISLGDISFGQPNRITCSIGLGRDGLIDIEREARLGGPIHTKGVLILSGLLADRYAQDKPLGLSARLVFEQTYSGVEGDSASSAEAYALLSSLSALPLRQGIAVTGSVNQKGEVQAVGGVNEKVEGFFGVCQARGLTGDQGVLIPASNVSNLMLKEEVVEAVRQGRFHIWPVRTIDEGIEILTGVPGGIRQPDGSFPSGCVGQRVDESLRRLAQTMQEFSAHERWVPPRGQEAPNGV